MNTPEPCLNVEALNEQSLNTLVRAITLSQDQFALVLVRCNYTQLRLSIMQQLKARCPQPIHEITLPESTKTLYTTIHLAMKEAHAIAERTPNAEPYRPHALMVFGLETVSAIDAVLTATNLVREELRKQFPCPLVLWVNEPVLQKMTRLAPDLKSWAGSSIIRFELPIADLVRSLKTHTERLFRNVLSAGDERFQPSWAIAPNPNTLRQAELELALDDLHSHNYPIDPALQANLEFLLGQTSHAQGELETARECYERSLQFWQVEAEKQEQAFHSTPSRPIPLPSALEREACILVHLGLWWRSYAMLQRSAYDSACQMARDFFQQSLELFEEAHRQDLVAKFIIPLAEVLQKLGQWDELERVARNALVLHSLYVDPVRQARDHGFLAEVAIVHSAWTTAQQEVETALRILAAAAEQLTEFDHIDPHLENILEISRRYHEGWYLLMLARAKAKLGKMESAIAHLEVAASQTLPQDNPQLHIQILQTLQNLYFQKGRYLEAFQTKQNRRSLEQQFGFRAFVGALRLEPQRYLLNRITDQTETQALLAQEIKASGRLQDVNRLVERMGRNDYKLTVIHGPSGVGKSSTVTAGFAPALQDHVIGSRIAIPIILDVYTDWQTVLSQLLASTIASQVSLSLDDSDIAESDIPGFSATPYSPTPTPLAQLQYAVDRNLLPVLILDQFEEFFFTYDTPLQRRPFYEFLRDCLNLPFVKVVLVLREDYLHYLLEFQRITPLNIIDNDILGRAIRYPLGDFSPKDAKSVIQTLTNQAQFYLEEDLVDALVEDLAGELRAVRPIELQVVGAQIQAENITTLAQYLQRGPKEKLVERSLESVVQDCGAENEQAARDVLFLLTNENGTRPLKTRDDLEADLVDLGLTTEIQQLDLVLKVLVGSGLIFVIPETPDDRFQLVHDYLVTVIRQQHKAGFAEELEKERELRKLKEEELRYALLEEQRERQRAEMAEIDALGLASQALLVSHDQLGALLASIKAAKQVQESQVTGDLKTLTTGRLWSILYSIQKTYRGQGQQRSPRIVAANPDDQPLASSTSDDLNHLMLQTFEGLQGAVWSVCFSPDGQTLVSAGDDGTIKLWSRDGKALQTFEGSQGAVLSVCFSPDGQTLVSAGDDGSIKFWSCDGKALHSFDGHQSSIWSVCFSPDGQMLASAGDDGTIKLWSCDGKALQTFEGHQNSVWSVCFSPDGQRLATAGDDGTIKLWSRDGKALQTFEGHQGAVLSVFFSPDGQTIASTSDDRTIRLWSLDGKELQTFKEHQGTVWSVCFSPDGQTIASASDDKTIKLWNWNLADLLTQGCNWLRAYMTENPPANSAHFPEGDRPNS